MIARYLERMSPGMVRLVLLVLTFGLMAVSGWILAYGVAFAADGEPNPGQLNNAALWAIVVGFLQAPLQAIIQRPQWSAQAKSILTFALSFVLAGVQLFFEGALGDSLEAKDYVRTFLVTFVAAQGFYRMYWKPAEITKVIEEKTAP